MLERDMANHVQIQCKDAYIYHKTNTLWKGMNPTILPTGMCK